MNEEVTRHEIVDGLCPMCFTSWVERQIAFGPQMPRFLTGVGI